MADYSKLDHWSLKAQKEGYPARSVYKLKEMDEKFGLLFPDNYKLSGNSDYKPLSGKELQIPYQTKQELRSIKRGRSHFSVLDLGAAPGSWSLYVLRKFFFKADISVTDKNINGTDKASGDKRQVSLVSVDLSPLSRDYDKGLFDSEAFTFIHGDFTHSEIKEAILSHGPYSLLLSDAAPATTGNRSVDTLRSLELAEAALDYATSALLHGGNLVIKVFQGGDTGSLLKAMRGLFKTAKGFKPEASRTGSFETYYLGLGKK